METNQQLPQPTHSPPAINPPAPYFTPYLQKTPFPEIIWPPLYKYPPPWPFYIFLPLSKKNKAHLRFGCDNCPRFARRKTAAFSTETAAPPPPPPLRRVRGGRGGARHESGGGSRALGVMWFALSEAELGLAVSDGGIRCLEGAFWLAAIWFLGVAVAWNGTLFAVFFYFVFFFLNIPRISLPIFEGFVHLCFWRTRSRFFFVAKWLLFWFFFLCGIFLLFFFFCDVLLLHFMFCGWVFVAVFLFIYFWHYEWVLRFLFVLRWAFWSVETTEVFERK